MNSTYKENSEFQCLIALKIAYSAELMHNNNFFKLQDITYLATLKLNIWKIIHVWSKVGKKPKLKKQEMCLKKNISRDQKVVWFHRVNSIFSSNMCTITRTLIVQYINRAQSKHNFELKE
jgi:hypothetical protein